MTQSHTRSISLPQSLSRTGILTRSLGITWSDTCSTSDPAQPVTPWHTHGNTGKRLRRRARLYHRRAHTGSVGDSVCRRGHRRAHPSQPSTTNRKEDRHDTGDHGVGDFTKLGKAAKGSENAESPQHPQLLHSRQGACPFRVLGSRFRL